MRGFWVDEKVEAGHWKEGGLLYRIGKWWERRFFRSADAIVSLTEAGVRAFHELGYRVPSGVAVDVIPTCVDLERFTPGPRDRELTASLGLDGAIVIGCIGTMSNWYMRDDMLQYLARLTQGIDRSRILIVTREDHNRLRQDAERAGIPGDRLVITRAEFADMPRFTRLFDAGLFLIRPAPSKRGSAATKLAEFLACGVPVIINDGVGDSGVIVKRAHVGVVLPTVDAQSAERSLPEVRTLLEDPAIDARCRKVATELFDIERGVEKYRCLYERLSPTRDGRARLSY
jgi:glycosyltransferase involved in cell wall biosynthesis